MADYDYRIVCMDDGEEVLLSKRFATYASARDYAKTIDKSRAPTVLGTIPEPSEEPNDTPLYCRDVANRIRDIRLRMICECGIGDEPLKFKGSAGSANRLAESEFRASLAYLELAAIELSKAGESLAVRDGYVRAQEAEACE